MDLVRVVVVRGKESRRRTCFYIVGLSVILSCGSGKVNFLDRTLDRFVGARSTVRMGPSHCIVFLDAIVASMEEWPQIMYAHYGLTPRVATSSTRSGVGHWEIK